MASILLFFVWSPGLRSVFPGFGLEVPKLLLGNGTSGVAEPSWLGVWGIYLGGRPPIRV